VAEVARDRTALTRHQLSRPVKLALEDGLLGPEASFFDYGCGRGSDVRLLSDAGYRSAGWDPHHLPEAARLNADIVNLGYVVNVIEAQDERAAVLEDAWRLARSILIVAARTAGEDRDLAFREPMADGVRTSRNTFQKFYDQQELKGWIAARLGAEPVAAGPGIFYVFRDADAREAYRARKIRRRIAAPSVSLSERRCRDHPELVAALVAFFTERGRLPRSAELAEGGALEDAFGSIGRAFSAVRRTNPTVDWDGLVQFRREDLALYLALSRFERGRRWSSLAPTVQDDVRALFGTYAAGRREADALLHELGMPGAIDRACAAATVGKLTPTALYVHRSALDRLPLLLRAFEGCGRGYLGEVEGANVIKLYRHEPKLSYLSYPDFESEPHPALAFSLNVDLRAFRLKTRRFVGQPNPPVLHRKECFVADDHPRRETFARLTGAEEAAGLLDKTDRIGLRHGWHAVLAEHGLSLKGHRLVRQRLRQPRPARPAERSRG
jgi:DNA phosphorothioation-associated putative methyltransferase